MAGARESPVHWKRPSAGFCEPRLRRGILRLRRSGEGRDYLSEAKAKNARDSPVLALIL